MTDVYKIVISKFDEAVTPTLITYANTYIMTVNDMKQEKR